MDSKNGVIFDIKRFAIHDGPGIRTTIFFKGCPLNCWWCHNPESQNFQIEQIRKTNYFKKRDSENYEVIGKLLSISEVLKEIMNDLIFFDESGGGVTFSGGEALIQSEFLYKLSKKCKEKGIHTTLDTCGYAPINVIQRISKNIDLFLYDLKFMDEKMHIRYTGVSNNLIIENLNYLSQQNKEIIIRIPIIPNITDNKHNLKEISQYITKLNLTKVSLLSYNRIGIEKYRRLNLEYKLPDLKPPTKKMINDIKKILVDFGLQVEVDL